MLKRWIIIDWIMEVFSMIFPVDALLRNSDDPAVSDLNRSIGQAFGKKLVAAREKTGLTQEELGYLSSVNRSEISQLELGRHVPRLDTVIKLAGGLNVEPCELIGDVRWKPPPIGPEMGGLYKLGD